MNNPSNVTLTDAEVDDLKRKYPGRSFPMPNALNDSELACMEHRHLFLGWHSGPDGATCTYT